jgi:subtilisin family serine protease
MLAGIQSSMNSRRSILGLIAWAAISVAMLDLLVSCGDPKYRPPSVGIAFDPSFLPPAQLETGAYAGVAAIVTNGNNNNIVSFSCTPVGECGTFTPASAGSSIPVCYLAPAQIPADNTVTVTATAKADPTKSVSAMITIVSGAPNPCP